MAASWMPKVQIKSGDSIVVSRGLAETYRRIESEPAGLHERVARHGPEPMTTAAEPARSREVQAGTTVAFPAGRRLARDETWPTSSANLMALCNVVAVMWCQSFGVDRQRPRRRLSSAIYTEFVDAPGDVLIARGVVETLHRFARDAIEAWFARSGLDGSGQNFDELRLRFLMISRTGPWSEQFLALDVDRGRLRTALSAVRFAATPPSRRCKMPRQDL